MKNKKIKLSELIESPITGEWGKEIGKSENPNTVKVIRTTNFTNSGEINYSNITLRDIESQKCEKKRLKYGDIILEKSGGTDLNPVGRVVFFDKDDTNDIYLTNNFTTILRVKDKRINSKFLLLFLLYNYKYRGLHKFYNKTTGIQNLQVSNFINQMFVPLPEIEIQNKIIKVLENIKTVIKKQKEQLELLENLKKSQFFEMFGDPIKNEKGWKIKKLEEITDKISSGATPTGGKENYRKTGISLIRSMNVHNGYFEYKDLAHISNEQAEQLKNVEIKLEDVLLNITGASITRCCLVPSNVLPARVNQHVMIIRKKSNVVNSIFLNRLFLNDIYKQKLLHLGEANGATRQALTKVQVGSLKIILPPLELQNKFATKIEAIQKLKFEIEKSLKETENLYNSLMQKFFSNK